MLISPAYAQAAAGGGDPLTSMLIPMVLIFAIFWFLLIRPQRQKQKQHQALLADLKKGDRVITAGGIIGTISKAKREDAELTIEIAEGIEVQIMRTMVADVIRKKVAGEPQGGAQADAKPRSLLGGLFNRS